MSSVEQKIGIFTTDANLVIRSWDSWLANALQIPSEKAQGESLIGLFPELEKRGMIRRFERVLKEGTVESLAPAFHRYLLACPPAKPSNRFDKMQQHVTIAPLRQNESIVGTIVTIEDVTARLDREHELAEQLASPDESVRLQAAQVLAEEETHTSAKQLMNSLGDESWRVRKTAVDGLARKAGAEEINNLLRALREDHRNPGVLNSALQVLALSGIDAIEPLAEFAGDADVDLRIYATQALGNQHDARAISVLVKALEDQDTNVRYHAIEALGKLRAIDAVDALIEIAESREFSLAFPALDTLTLIGDSRIAPRLVPLLEDEMLRSPATEALGRLGDEEIIAPLIALLNTQDAPAQVIAQALASLYERYQNSYQEGSYIADLVRNAISGTGVQNLLEAINRTRGENLRTLARVLGWLEGEAVEQALVRLLGQSTARREVIEALVRYGERVTQLLTEQLHAEDLETRKAAVIALGRIGDAAAVPALVQALTNDDELALVAAGALGKIGDRRAFKALLDMIGSPDVAVRQAAVAAINSLGHPDMAKRAVQLLGDANSYIRESAVKIAGYFGYRECTDLLLERCFDPEESVRRAAIEHIPYLEDERVVAIITEAIENATPQVRAAAANALAQIDREPARSHLLKAANDPDPWVRYFAIRSIGNHRYSESLEVLTQKAQTDPANHVRIAALDSLGKLEESRAIAVLASFIESADLNLARAALKSLGQIHHVEALPPLLDALRLPEAARRVEALYALSLRDTDAVIESIQWVAAADTDTTVAQAAVDALSRLASPAAIAALVNLTAETARREASIEALSRLGEQKIEVIGKGLTHSQASVRRAILDALGRMKHPLASALLTQALSDEEASVRLAAVNALTHLGNRSAERELLRLMRTDPDTAVRRAAQKALSR
jgi:HEAT repeat protein